MAKRGPKQQLAIVEDKVSRSTSPATVRRIRDLAMRGAADANLGTPVGRMYLNQEINSRQLDAAIKYASLRSAADMIMNLPRRTTQAANINSVRGLSLVSDDEGRQDAIVNALYRAETLHITSKAHRDALIDVVACELEPVGHEQKMRLKEALTGLANHFGMVSDSGY